MAEQNHTRSVHPVSFSRTIKEELAEQFGTARHCQIAELAALISADGSVAVRRNGNLALAVESENRLVVRKADALIRRAFHTVPETGISVSGEQHRSRICTAAVPDSDQASRILMGVKYLTRSGVLRETELPVSGVLLRSSCCRRAFLRGAFLASGSVSDPNRSYHLEIVCGNREKAEQIQEMMRSFSVDARTVVRKGLFVVYVKESDGISDFFSLTGAYRGLMQMENIRILHGISGSVNRSVNCETANLAKTVEASVEQIRCIEKIRDTIGLSELSPQLREMAEVRLENPDAPLKDLGGLLNPPVGKSGVNHRLRRLKQIAEDIDSGSFPGKPETGERDGDGGFRK